MYQEHSDYSLYYVLWQDIFLPLFPECILHTRKYVIPCVRWPTDWWPSSFLYLAGFGTGTPSWHTQCPARGTAVNTAPPQSLPRTRMSRLSLTPSVSALALLSVNTQHTVLERELLVTLYLEKLRKREKSYHWSLFRFNSLLKWEFGSLYMHLTS